jgi:DNA repair photolyase
MPLNRAKGNMFDFISHTWNPIKGACFHDCEYCYMKRCEKMGEIKPDSL